MFRSNEDIFKEIQQLQEENEKKLKALKEREGKVGDVSIEEEIELNKKANSRAQDIKEDVRLIMEKFLWKGLRMTVLILFSFVFVMIVINSELFKEGLKRGLKKKHSEPSDVEKRLIAEMKDSGFDEESNGKMPGV